MSKCSLCPRNCNVDRSSARGVCGASDEIKIAKYYLHKYEEPPVSGTNGSGTVFFCGCSLRCVFCQNYDLSRNLRGKTVSVAELADIFKELETKGAHNVNLVTPSHYADKIARAVESYRPNVPIIYNTHGYEKLSTLDITDRFVDVYLPDVKYFSPVVSARYTGVKDYFDVASKAVERMIKNKPLKFGDDGLIKQGVIVRHLVLPQNVGDSKKILEWFSQYKDDAYISIMSQYTPFGDVSAYPELQRKLTKREYSNVIDYAISLGLEKTFYQKEESADAAYIPEWDY